MESVMSAGANRTRTEWKHGTETMLFRVPNELQDPHIP